MGIAKAVTNAHYAEVHKDEVRSSVDKLSAVRRDVIVLGELCKSHVPRGFHPIVVSLPYLFTPVQG